MATSGLPGPELAVSALTGSALKGSALTRPGPARSGLTAPAGALCRPDDPLGLSDWLPGPAPGLAGAVQVPVDRPSPTAFQVCVEVTSAAGSLTASTE